MAVAGRALEKFDGLEDTIRAHYSGGHFSCEYTLHHGFNNDEVLRVERCLKILGYDVHVQDSFDKATVLLITWNHL